MENYSLILPIAILMTYSQLIVKWGSNRAEFLVSTAFLERLALLLTDPMILSAYAAVLLASFVWLNVVSQLSLTETFPVYTSFTFIVVLFGR